MNIIKKYLPILTADEKMADILKTPVHYVARRACNVGNLESPNIFPKTNNATATSWLSTIGFHKCGHRICKVCSHVQLGCTFESTSYSNASPYKVRSFINCNSKNIINLITCTSCRLQYVGSTSTELKVHIRRHLSDIQNISAVNVSAASRHFITTHDRDISSFKFMGIESFFES